MARLTKRTVDAAKPNPIRDTFLWDEDLHGFGLRVTKSGAKSYVAQYRDRGGRSRRVTLAKAGMLTTEEARHFARETLAAVIQGADPAAERMAQREAPSVKTLVERFKREHVERRLKPATRREYLRLLDDFVVKKLGTKKVADVTRADVAKLHGDQSAHPAQANKLLAVVSKLLTEAEVYGWRTEGTNPARHVKKYPERKRERYLSAVEVSRIGRATAELEAEKKITRFFALLVWLLLTTGCRSGEWITAKWEDVDLENGLLYLPDSKTGQRHVVLSAVSVDLLRRAPRQEGSPWVITGKRRDAAGEWTHLNNPAKSWIVVRDRASKKVDKLPDVDLSDVTLHTLRHSFASTGAAAGVGLQLVGGLLGHRQASTTSRYSHLGDSPQRAAADVIASQIAAAMNAAPPATVVPIGKTLPRKRSR